MVILGTLESQARQDNGTTPIVNIPNFLDIARMSESERTEDRAQAAHDLAELKRQGNPYLNTLWLELINSQNHQARETIAMVYAILISERAPNVTGEFTTLAKSMHPNQRDIAAMSLVYMIQHKVPFAFEQIDYLSISDDENDRNTVAHALAILIKIPTPSEFLDGFTTHISGKLISSDHVNEQDTAARMLYFLVIEGFEPAQDMIEDLAQNGTKNQKAVVFITRLLLDSHLMIPQQEYKN